MSLLTVVITTPLEMIADSLGAAYQKFFLHIPALWQPVMMLTIILMAALFSIMFCRYRIRIPFIVCIEPTSGKSRSNDSSTRAVSTYSSTE